MEKLPMPRLGSRGLPPGSGAVASPRKSHSGPLPKILNPLTDVEIPRSTWSPWKEDGKPRLLRRVLTTNERLALERRRDELAPVMAAGSPSDRDRIALALSDMFGGFTSMRQGDDEAAARLDSVMRVLAEFPPWAIEKACRSIQQNGVWRKGRFDREWPPNDPEIAKEVRDQVRLYGDAYNEVVALLGAEVEA